MALTAAACRTAEPSRAPRFFGGLLLLRQGDDLEVDYKGEIESWEKRRWNPRDGRTHAEPLSEWGVRTEGNGFGPGEPKGLGLTSSPGFGKQVARAVARLGGRARDHVRGKASPRGFEIRRRLPPPDFFQTLIKPVEDRRRAGVPVPHGCHLYAAARRSLEGRGSDAVLLDDLILWKVLVIDVECAEMRSTNRGVDVLAHPGDGARLVHACVVDSEIGQGSMEA